MDRFRKKPVVVEAMQVATPGDHAAALLWIKSHGVEAATHMDGSLRIRTLEGDMRAQDGDWIIKGVNGEFYPCKPDIFEETYDPEPGGDDA